jgi:hypothetical protein
VAPNGVPQFAQNLALSGFAKPQFGQVIVMPTLTNLGTQKVREFWFDATLKLAKW